MDRIIFLLVSGFFTINAFAQQPTFFGSTPKQQSSAVPTAKTPRPVLSPSEFSSKVSEISTKNDAAFKQHLNQQISQIPPAVVPKVPLPKATEHGTQAAPPLGAIGTSPSTTTQTEEIVTSTPAPIAAMPAPPAAQKAPPPESYSTTPPPSTGGSGTFTGFGTGTGTSGTTTAPQKSQGSSGGGWNIKY